MVNDEQVGEQMVLGEQLENPYSVTNMKRALKSLQISSFSNAKVAGVSSAVTEDMITTIHYYVKFKPKTEEELLLLKSDTLVNYFPYPLDYEIKEEGDEYRDPEVSEDQPTYQYASVKVDHQLPNNIDYEIIEELFIPDEDFDEIDEELIEEEVAYRNNLAKVQQVINIKDTDFWLILVDESLKLTNNLEEEDTEVLNGAKTAGWFSSKWRPAGKITLWDTNKKKYIGVEGVKVRVTRWFTTRKCFTDSNGKFRSAGRFRGKARYKMDWERHHFALRSGFWASAQYTGPYKKGDWNWQIENGDRHQYYGTIFRAAYHYYYKDIKGLRRPPLNTFWKSQLRIRASRKQDAGKLGSHLGVRRAWGLGDGVYIYTFGESSSQTYATTIHELAHASHWNFQRVNHNVSKLILAESWARGVQWELTRMVYPTYVPQYSTLGYTGFVQDLIDGTVITKRTDLYYDKDEGKTFRCSTGFKNYTDNVTGYNIRQLEDALRGINTFNGWRNQIKSMNPNNQSKESVDEAYNFWNNQ